MGLMDRFESLPGWDLVEKGLRDLAQGEETVEALLVAIGSPRLRGLGITVPESPVSSPEHRLYEVLAESEPDSAHGRYNALIRRLVNLERAAECGPIVNDASLRAFMRELGREADIESSVYFTGGATVVLLGWRRSTIDADIRLVPDFDRLLRAIPKLEESLRINVKLASPADFIPELPGWRERSIFIAREGKITFYHYDLYSQALSKVERAHRQDLDDVEVMLKRRLIDPRKALELFAQIEPQLYRYPAVHGPSFRSAAERVFGKP